MLPCKHDTTKRDNLSEVVSQVVSQFPIEFKVHFNILYMMIVIVKQIMLHDPLADCAVDWINLWGNKAAYKIWGLEPNKCNCVQYECIKPYEKTYST